MKLKEIYEDIKSSSAEQEIIDTIESAYRKRFPDKEFLYKVKKHKDFVIIPSNQMGKLSGGEKNRCETNTFNHLHRKFQESSWGNSDNPQRMVDFSMHTYYPVAGYQVTKSGWLIEHWWVYDKSDNEHMETCPFDPTDLLGYIGIINYDINDDIRDSEHVFDVDFFKGGNPYHRYFK
tara:strand:- start:3525 stop:4055 length:531 start_codon:yes stop_codon:yes gene_type:complete